MFLVVYIGKKQVKELEPLFLHHFADAVFDEGFEGLDVEGSGGFHRDGLSSGGGTKSIVYEIAPVWWLGADSKTGVETGVLVFWGKIPGFWRGLLVGPWAMAKEPWDLGALPTSGGEEFLHLGGGGAKALGHSGKKAVVLGGLVQTGKTPHNNCPVMFIAVLNVNF